MGRKRLKRLKLLDVYHERLRDIIMGSTDVRPYGGTQDKQEAEVIPEHDERTFRLIDKYDHDTRRPTERPSPLR